VANSPRGSRWNGCGWVAETLYGVVNHALRRWVTNLIRNAIMFSASPRYLPVFLLLLVGMVSTNTGVARADDKKLDLPTFGLSIPEPDGYQRSLERSSWQVFKFEVLNAGGTSLHLIALQFAKPAAGETAETLAKAMAHGAPLKPRKWGGLDAFEFAGDPKAAKDDWYNARNITVDHDGYAFLLTYASVPGHEDFMAYDRVVDGTVWEKRKPLVESVHPRGQTVKLEGGIVCDLPDPFRLDSKNTKNGQQLFVASDFTGEKSSMKLVHIVQDGDNTVTLDKLTADFPFHTEKPVTWDKSADGLGALSSVVHLADKGDIACIVLISDDKKYVHRFILNVLPGADDQKVTRNVAKELFDSLATAK
jgi:hypothetical protein